jgi:hypothetical protein
MDDQNLLPSVPAEFAVVSTHSSFKEGGRQAGRRLVIKIIAESLSRHDEKHVVPTPLSGIKVGRRVLTLRIQFTQ